MEEDEPIVDDQMICEVTAMLDDTEDSELTKLCSLLESLGHVSPKDTVSEVYSPPRVSALA